MYSFDLTKISCSIYLIVMSLYHITEIDILFLLKEVAIFLSPKPGRK